MKRTIVSFIPTTKNGNFALASDGTLWRLEVKANEWKQITGYQWYQIPSLPQEDD